MLAGRPTLRTPEGERELRAGDCVLFPLGPEGAHQLRNDSGEPARFLMVSNLASPEVAPYPDSGKVGVWAGELELFVREDASLDYWEGESDWTPPEAT